MSLILLKEKPNKYTVHKFLCVILTSPFISTSAVNMIIQGHIEVKKMQNHLGGRSYLETDESNPPKLSSVRKPHTINFSNGATTFKETTYILLGRVVRNASNINFGRNI